LVPTASANGPCGAPPCYSEFTVDGQPPPAGLSLNVMTQPQNGYIQMLLTTPPFNFELSSVLNNNSNVHVKLNLGTYDPVVFATTGNVVSYSETSGGSNNTVTVDAHPSSSSWKNGCMVGNCGGPSTPLTADVDYSSMLLGAVTDLQTPTPPDPGIADAMRGSWLSTNGQSFSFPMFSDSGQTLSFSVAAPHFKKDGTTVNTGFFRAFLPDAVIQQMGIADPSTVTTGSFDVTSTSGEPVVFDVSHQSSPTPGALIDSGTNPPALPPFHYSSPTFTVAPATVSSDATLKALKLSAGTLSPKFKPSETTYSAGAVARKVRKVKVTPTSTSPKAKIEVRLKGGSYASVPSGSASRALHLVVGSNKIQVRVTAESKARKTYSISIKRKG
jgi:hypothetical protein